MVVRCGSPLTQCGVARGRSSSTDNKFLELVVAQGSDAILQKMMTFDSKRPTMVEHLYFGAVALLNRCQCKCQRVTRSVEVDMWAMLQERLG